MSIFVKATEAPRYRDSSVAGVSLFLAAVFIVLAVAQLFSFEKFPDVLSGYWILGGTANASLLAALLVTFEVFALPFLLRLRVSPLMRLLSIACMWLTGLVWLVLGLWVVTSTNALSNSGVLGATIPLQPGWWQVGFAVVLLALIGYVTWQQWPTLRFRRAK